MLGDIPAVVVGGTLNGLGVIRSLSQGRMPIYVLDSTRRCAASWSRHCTFVQTPSLEGEDLVRTLVDLARHLRSRPVLILTAEQSVSSISMHRERIEPLYRISLPSAPIVEALADKTLFHALGEQAGFALPRAVALRDPTELAGLQGLLPPLIIKPADKLLVLRGVCARAVRAETLRDAERAAVRMLASAPHIIVQEWIDGPDTQILFTLFSCDRRGDLIGAFTGRKLVCSPPGIGNTAVCVAAPEEAAELRAQTLRFIESTRYRGLGSLEFKRDPRTGRALIIEPTVGRTDWQEEIATLCGVNLPLLTYWAEAERPARASMGRSECIAWRSAMEHGVPAALLGPRVRIFDGFFRWDDPLPALYHYGYEALALRLWRRVHRGGSMAVCQEDRDR